MGYGATTAGIWGNYWDMGCLCSPVDQSTGPSRPTRKIHCTVDSIKNDYSIC